MTATGSKLKTEPTPLPRLRRDLQIELVPVRGGGFPAVVVTDPIRGSYFRLAWPESGAFLLWQEANTVEELCGKLSATYGVAAATPTIADVVHFAFTNQLTEKDSHGGWANLAALHGAGRHNWLMTLVHGYLFFRVPIFYPEPLLQRALPYLAFVFRPQFWAAMAALSLLGLYFATRQWTAIQSAVHDVLRLDGLPIYAMAIFLLKAIHELGHGLATVRFGCRVPTMGIAVMLGAPVFYTDTSDSWRLSKPSERLAIMFSGVAAELIVASVAIFLWSFLAEGVLRQICFALATTSIVLSLTINLNPFMRFDGYFALSDYLGIPNLQSRAFKLATWRLREFVFALGHHPPESLPPRTMRRLTIYATLTALYRLFLFLSIAAIVYVMFGKAIGVLLAAFEIAVFIALPIAGELGAWWKLRWEIVARRRALGLLGIFTPITAALFVPWVSTVEVPAVLTTTLEEAVHLPFAAKLVSIDVVDGSRIQQGDVMFTADAADLEQQRQKAILEHRAIAFQADRLHASEKERENRIVIESRLARAREKIAALDRQIAQLVIRAPFAGKVVDVDPEISTGLWLNQKRVLARVISTRGTRIKGLVSDTEIARIPDGARAVFIPDDAAASRLSIALISIAPAADGRLSEPILADRHGGGISVGDENGSLRVRQGWFELSFEGPDEGRDQVMRGIVRVDAASISPAVLLWRQLARVLVREQSF